MFQIMAHFTCITFLPDGHEGYDASGKNIYMETCKSLGVVPVSYFLRHVMDDTFVMRYRGLGPLGAKALSRPLEVGGECIGDSRRVKYWVPMCD